MEVVPYDKKHLTHKDSSIELDWNFSSINFNNLFNYRIFPVQILSTFPQWVQENRKIQVGDTIVQQISIPPLKKLAQRILVGVRVKEIIDNKTAKGFSYETLQGHVEKGCALFLIEQVNDKVFFRIETYSAPERLKLFQSLSSWYQDYCIKKALINFKNNLSLDMTNVIV